MDWLAKYWWILVLVFLVGVLLNVIKDLKRIDHKKFLANKPELPPHRDFNDKWDDEDDLAEERSAEKVTGYHAGQVSLSGMVPTAGITSRKLCVRPASNAISACAACARCNASRALRPEMRSRAHSSASLAFFFQPPSQRPVMAMRCIAVNDAGNLTMSVADGARTQNRPAHASLHH
ncbi:Putative inner membrane protein [Salmonella enterica subsp. enterica serovar Typhimurium]|nr:Putative inner membrane protein [Salmonella enterica subsp. enterica serovar Typhimurium]